jgi:hypothetical protein
LGHLGLKFGFQKDLDDLDLTVRCSEIEEAEHWDSPKRAVKRFAGLANALATGDKSAIGDREKVNR